MRSNAERELDIRLPLIGAGLLIALTIVAVAAVRLEGTGPDQSQKSLAELRAASRNAEAGAALDIRFEDRSDGGVIVRDARSNVVIDVLEPGSNGFVRGVLRALIRGRTARGIGSEAAFSLSRGSDGLLTLTDTATGQHVELNAFGRTNMAAFARLMPDTRKTNVRKAAHYNAAKEDAR